MSPHTRLTQVNFFKNFGAICVFAFLGTFLSALAVGTLSYAATALGIASGFSFLDALIFGALISATGALTSPPPGCANLLTIAAPLNLTDPVTVLAVFQHLGVNRTLYSLVFGESVLNDAVAIVLYHTLLQFQVQSQRVEMTTHAPRQPNPRCCPSPRTLCRFAQCGQALASSSSPSSAPSSWASSWASQRRCCSSIPPWPGVPRRTLSDASSFSSRSLPTCWHKGCSCLAWSPFSSMVC